MDGLAYRGHYIRLIPEQEKDHWVARVIAEVHTSGQTEKIYYRDHTQTYGSRDEAEQASIEFGKRMIILGLLTASYPLAQFFGSPILGGLSPGASPSD